MKKVSIILCLLMLGVAFNGFSQAPAPSDFFAGKWKLIPPDGLNIDKDAPSPQIDIVRKEGKLIVNLWSEYYINSRVEKESATELSILYDIVSNPHMPKDSVKATNEFITLTKVDDNTLETSLQGMGVLLKRVK